MSDEHRAWRSAAVPFPPLVPFGSSMRAGIVKHTVVALARNQAGVLNRAVNVFRRRGLNIDSLTVSRTEDPAVSRLVWVFDARDVTPLVNQLEKLIDVLDVHVVGGPDDARPAMFALPQADGVA